MNRTTAMIATGVTALLCGCPGLSTCLFGLIFAIGGATGNATINGEVADPTTAMITGLASVCGGLILVLIPVAVGFFTLRNAQAA